jgi:chromosome segregation and condensation protein ScpB
MAHLVGTALALQQTDLSMTSIAAILGVSRATAYRLMKVRERLVALIDDIDDYKRTLNVNRVVAAHRKATRKKKPTAAKSASGPRRRQSARSSRVR